MNGMLARGLLVCACMVHAAKVTASSISQGPRTYIYGRASFPTGPAPVALARGDLDGDGVEDLVTANLNGGTVSVLIGTSRGSFRAPVDCAAGVDPIALALGDFDGDGELDMAVANHSGSLFVFTSR